MEEPLWVFLLRVFGGPVVSGLVAAGIMSAITYWLSRRRFIGERWWDRKADAYGSIIGSLVSMVLLLDSWVELHRRSGGKRAAGKEFWDEYPKALAKVECVVTEGDYVISLKASRTLAELVKALKVVVAPGLDPSGSDGFSLLLTDLEWRRSKIEACLEVLRDEAKLDLRVK